MNSIRVYVSVGTRLCATLPLTCTYYSWLMHCLFAEQTNNHNKRIEAAIANRENKNAVFACNNRQ